MENDKISNYRETQINTASRGKLIVILYDGLIKFIDIAIENIPKKKFDIASNNIIKAQDIVNELSMSLNMEAGEISGKLISIYSFLYEKLIEANVKKDVKSLRFIRKMAFELRDGWNQIANKSTVSDIKKMRKTGGIDIAG